MKNRLHSLPVIAVYAFTMVSPCFSADPSDENATRILDKYGSRIYTVFAYTVRPAESTDQKKTSPYVCRNIGTAFSLDSEDHLITFNCVIKSAEHIRVISRIGEKFNARALGCDENDGLNVLEIDHRNEESSPRILFSDNITPARKVVLLGVARKEGLTANTGVIGTMKPHDGTFVVNVDGLPCTSGSTVFDTGGNLLGFVVYRIEGDDDNGGNGMNEESVRSHTYAVLPVKYAFGIAQTIINKEKGGCGWLGIYTNFKTDPSGPEGALIHQVIKDSPAEKSGMKKYDYIIEFNNIPITNPLELVKAVTSTRAGDSVPVRIRRENRIYSYTVTLARYP